MTNFFVIYIIVVQGGVRYIRVYWIHAFSCVARKMSDIVVPVNKVADSIHEVIITY